MTEKLKIVSKFKTERFETMKTMEATTELWLPAKQYGRYSPFGLYRLHCLATNSETGW